MAVISGILGRIGKGASTLGSIRKWEIDTKDDLKSFAASNTSGGTGRIGGNDDWSGSYEAYGHTPAIKPGDEFVFHGSLDGAKGWTGNAKCADVEINWNIESGEPISHRVTFEGNGALTAVAEAIAADTSVPNPPSPIGCVFKWKTVETGSPVETTLLDVTRMSLKLTRANPTFNSSTQAGITGRVTGNFDASCSIGFVSSADMALLPPKGAIHEIKLYVDASLFWQLKWARLGSIGGLSVDIEDTKPVAGTLEYAMAGFANVGAPPGTPTLGTIVDPGSVAWWP